MMATAMVLAQEMAGHGMHGGSWWPLVPLFWVLFWVGLIVFLVRSRRRWHGRHPQRSGEGVLAERFARGEIDEQEYRDRLDTLRHVGGPQPT